MHKPQTFYCGKLKCGVEIIKDSNFVQLETLDPNKVHNKNKILFLLFFL